MGFGLVSRRAMAGGDQLGRPDPRLGCRRRHPAVPASPGTKRRGLSLALVARQLDAGQRVVWRDGDAALGHTPPALSACLRGHENLGVHDVSWSPDGAILASGSGDRTVRFSEPHNRPGARPVRLPGAGRPAAGLVARRAFLVSSHRGDVFRIWDTRRFVQARPVVSASTPPPRELATLPAALAALHRLGPSSPARPAPRPASTRWWPAHRHARRRPGSRTGAAEPGRPALASSPALRLGLRLAAPHRPNPRLGAATGAQAN